MKNSVRDFTAGNPGKQMLLFFWPIILSMILQNLYNLADTWVIGGGYGFFRYRSGKWERKSLVKGGEAD